MSLPRRTVEPPPTTWRFPDPTLVDGDLVCVGGDLEPGTLLAAYRTGLFPMPLRRRTMGWWSPDPRGIIPLEHFHVSRSLRRSMRQFTATVDSAFVDVVTACADPRRPHGWITPAITTAYTTLHRLGWAHSVEVRTSDGGLAGGMYGIAIDGLFAGESMFHRVTDASKAALAHLVDRLRTGGFSLFDVQWSTPHLASMGAVEVPRTTYLAQLHEALGVDASWHREAGDGEDGGRWPS